jgi:probable phosphoglycerate mutase
MRIIIGRHGDSVGTKGKFHGPINHPLTSKGREEAYKLARDVKKYHPSIIYYSPLDRCRDTAKIVASELGIPTKPAKELGPLDVGDYDGKPIDKYLPRVRYHLMHTDVPFPNGGTVDEWAGKYLPFLERKLEDKKNETIMFLSHGRNIVLTKAYIKAGGLAPEFDKETVYDNKVSTEHGGHAIVSPNHFEIVTPRPVKVGES